METWLFKFAIKTSSKPTMLTVSDDLYHFVNLLTESWRQELSSKYFSSHRYIYSIIFCFVAYWQIKKYFGYFYIDHSLKMFGNRRCGVIWSQNAVPGCVQNHGLRSTFTRRPPSIYLDIVNKKFAPDNKFAKLPKFLLRGKIESTVNASVRTSHVSQYYWHTSFQCDTKPPICLMTAHTNIRTVGR